MFVSVCVCDVKCKRFVRKFLVFSHQLPSNYLRVCARRNFFSDGYDNRRKEREISREEF
jgi:hypothetical protein